MGSYADYDTVQRVSGSGHLRITVDSDQATVVLIPNSGTAGYSYAIAPNATGTTYDLTMKAGWNLVAAAPGTTFPGELWGWTGSSYESATEPVAWQGFWCKVGSAGPVEIQTVLGPRTITLTDGWNLIGNCMASPATLGMPGGMIAWIYDADTGYESRTTLQPGQGAWVKATAGQQVTLTSSGG